jgi:hypothetical protein
MLAFPNNLRIRDSLRVGASRISGSLNIEYKLRTVRRKHTVEVGPASPRNSELEGVGGRVVGPWRPELERGACVSADGGSWPDHGGWKLKRVGGFGSRPLARQPEFARGRLRQRGWADAGRPADGGPREGGWLGSSSARLELARGSLRQHGRGEAGRPRTVGLERVGGWVVVPRQPGLARGSLRQRGRGEAGHPTDGGS